MGFKAGDRVVAVKNGCDAGHKGSGLLHFNYEIGWKATISKGGTDTLFNFDNGRVIDGCSWDSFELIKEETKMTNFKPGDTVKIKNCTGTTKQFNGKTGKYLENMFPNDAYKHTVSFDGNDNNVDGCGYCFADSELEVIPQIAVGDKVTVRDGNDATWLSQGKMESVDVGGITVFNITDVSKELQRTIVCSLKTGNIYIVSEKFLKAYVAVPKFHKDQICECDDEYCRVVKVNKDSTYVITMQPSIYKDGSADIVVDESELSEVAQ